MITEPGIQKPCGVCKQWKDLERFSPMATGCFGRHTYCKPCRSKANLPQANQWRLDNPEKYKANMKKFVAKKSAKRKAARGEI